MIYSDDKDIAELAAGRFRVVKIAAIPLPPQSAQANSRSGRRSKAIPVLNREADPCFDSTAISTSTRFRERVSHDSTS
jgi:hypothetical protein